MFLPLLLDVGTCYCKEYINISSFFFVCVYNGMMTFFHCLKQDDFILLISFQSRQLLNSNQEKYLLFEKEHTDFNLPMPL
ncbi:hypothetical protein POUND7_006871 [Theobroma cacao]